MKTYHKVYSHLHIFTTFRSYYHVQLDALFDTQHAPLVMFFALIFIPCPIIDKCKEKLEIYNI